MKLKTILGALGACSIALLPAQTAAPEKPAIAQAAVEPKAETPVEKQAFKMFDIMSTLPEILGGIKDVASADAADLRLDKLLTQMKTEESALLKLEVPDNEAREKLDAKMKIKMKSMQEKMMPIMMGMQALPPEVSAKLGQMMQKFMQAAGRNDSAVDKYFKPDEEKEGGE